MSNTSPPAAVTAFDADHPSGGLLWAYWMTLCLCILSVPLSFFYLMLFGAYGRVTPIPWTASLPLLVTAMAWVTLDVLARAYRGWVQRPVWYLIAVFVAQCITVAGFAISAFDGTHGSGLAYVCMVMAATATGATVEILLRAIGARGLR